MKISCGYAIAFVAQSPIKEIVNSYMEAFDGTSLAIPQNLVHYKNVHKVNNEIRKCRKSFSQTVWNNEDKLQFLEKFSLQNFLELNNEQQMNHHNKTNLCTGCLKQQETIVMKHPMYRKYTNKYVFLTFLYYI